MSKLLAYKHRYSELWKMYNHSYRIILGGSPKMGCFTQTKPIDEQKSKDGRLVVEVRSDTFTQPTSGMLDAMAHCTYDDAVFHEDKTVLELQDKVAKMFGKEAAIFTPSGTMSNLIAVMCHCRDRGEEVIIGHASHVHNYEQGGISAVAHVFPRTLRNQPDGTFSADDVIQAIDRSRDQHRAATSLLVLENSQGSGKVLPMDYVTKICGIAAERGVKVHMDGARLFNAMVYLGVTGSEMCSSVDSVNICFSKGLGAPVGSVLAGSSDFIVEAVRMRKLLGGGWRKPGAMAAACLFSLLGATDRISTDHQHARAIAEVLNDQGRGIVKVALEDIQTNIIMINVLKGTAEEFVNHCEQICEEEKSPKWRGGVELRLMLISDCVCRLVLHSSVTADHVTAACDKLNFVFKRFYS